jgi:hypothetical protein
MSLKTYFPEAVDLPIDQQVHHVGKFYGDAIKAILLYLEKCFSERKISKHQLESEQFAKDITTALLEHFQWKEVLEKIPIPYHIENAEPGVAYSNLAITGVSMWLNYRIFILSHFKQEWPGFRIGLTKDGDVAICTGRAPEGDMVVNKSK